LPQDFVWLVAKPRFAYKRTGEKRPVLHVFNHRCTAGHGEQFLSSLRFENRGKLDVLGLEVDLYTHKPGY
jgi:hypothetical protein